MSPLVIKFDGLLGRNLANMLMLWGYYRELEPFARISDVRDDGSRRVVLTIDDAAKGRLAADALNVLATWREPPPYGLQLATKRAALNAKAKIDTWLAKERS